MNRLRDASAAITIRTTCERYSPSVKYSRQSELDISSCWGWKLECNSCVSVSPDHKRFITNDPLLSFNAFNLLRRDQRKVLIFRNLLSFRKHSIFKNDFIKFTIHQSNPLTFIAFALNLP